MLTEPVPLDCSPQPLASGTTLPADPFAASYLVANIVFPTCADTVVLSDLAGLAHAADLATEREAPLLLVDLAAPAVGDPPPAADPALVAELERLDADDVVWAGDPTATAQAETVAGTSLDASSPEPAAAPLGLAAAPLPTPGQPTWIAGPGQEAAALALLPGIVLGGGTIRAVSSTEPATLAIETTGLAAGDVALLEGNDPTTAWRIQLALEGTQLPGGGTEVFPDRRIVAFYGSPVTFRLGLLGEQGPQETIDRLLPVVESYRRPGEVVVPGFELIATVADSAAGDDGDYSKELDVEAMREWIEVATANDAFVIIDLQPGRTDFLTQARRYEEFLRLPNVGLALDPEWRLAPDEVHLTQIGSVDGAEVNLVVDYLVGLVREESLPPKILVLHQFQTAMITNRELIRTPEELAVVVHVDGQGPLGTKYGTYDAMLAAPIGPDQTLWWGWKNFLDEDTPMATPEQVNAVVPLPVVVTFL